MEGSQLERNYINQGAYGLSFKILNALVEHTNPTNSQVDVAKYLEYYSLSVAICYVVSDPPTDG